MNAPQRQKRTAVDTAVADRPAEADRSPGATATVDAPAVDSMDRDDWLCRVGDVARLLREQRRATKAEERQTAEEQG